MVVYHEAAHSRKLLLGNRTTSATQNIFLNLAGSCFRQLLDKRHSVRRLEVREVRARKFTEFIFSSVRIAPKHDERMRRLTPALMRKSDNRHLLHGRMTQQDS